MSKISVSELCLYFVCWISANFYSLYKLYEAQTDVLYNNTITETKPGWRFVGRPVDISDVEWNTWKFHMGGSWFYLTLQFIISETIRKVQPSMLPHWYLTSSLLYNFVKMDIKQYLFLFVSPVVYSIVTFSGGKRLSLWITSVLVLLIYNSLKYTAYVWSLFEHDNLVDEEIYLVLFTSGWIQLRCTSFCLDYVEKKEKLSAVSEKCIEHQESVSESLLKMLTYVFYLPMLHSGPLLDYNEFEKSFTRRNTSLTSRINRFTIDIMLYLIYTFLLEWSLHYIHFLAMQENIELLRKLPPIALSGGGLWMGLEFHVKYVIIYGVASAFTALDNIETPPNPRCIARIHVYSQMWRYFDVGLYRFLIKFIYLPCLTELSKYGARISKTIQKLLASLATFLFIFLWHGTTWAIFIWMTLNYFGITVESYAKEVAKSDGYNKFKKTILKTAGMETRFTALLCTPLLCLSAMSSFYLFAGYNVGNLFFECFRPHLTWNSLYIMTALYSCCHVSMALQNVPSRTAVKTFN
ncbi:protein-cysteine N-palmitoyltransferase Rasp [Plutella xylostella]|uniref:protein-cysteine N-palmitoyltransferase Rasp n=1 Tax=Plutella xylostella TaxID=51655 RepID=UPI002032838A|nr:protein-cysteine N-palmitoyltransferase Rasp [Plutella xylostella]